MGGGQTEINLGQLLMKRIKLLASTLRSRSDEFKQKLIENFKS